MKKSLKCGLVLLTMLMALSIGVALGEKDTAANKSMPTNEISESKTASAELDANSSDVADAKENETNDKNEMGEDNIIIDSVTFSPSVQYVELKNDENLEQNLTGWKLEVQNKTVFTVPMFKLDASARVKIHAGTGTDTKTDLYATNSLLTKANDEVSLLDVKETVVSRGKA